MPALQKIVKIFAFPFLSNLILSKTILNIVYRLFNQVTKRVDTPDGRWKSWNWRSEGDLMLNGAYFRPSGAGASTSYARASSLGAKSSSMVGTITSGAGVLGCRRGRQC